jgi:phosphonate degradation associated HDIG domain protein
MKTTDAIERIVSVFEQRGHEKYADEEVTQLQHALQCAGLARQAAAGSHQVAAALLHDIGHILGDDDLPADCGSDLDDHHETVAQGFLGQYFDESVCAPVRLHVAAKRYLCAIESGYEEQLSPTSLKSLQDQGGRMTEQEKLQFESEPFFREAVTLRRWDDLAKDKDAAEARISDFLTELKASMV